MSSKAQPPTPDCAPDREPEEGRILPPYGGATRCAAADCDNSVLDEDHGAYLHRNRESGKLVVLCGPCSRNAQMYASLRLPLVAL